MSEPILRLRSKLDYKITYSSYIQKYTQSNITQLCKDKFNPLMKQYMGHKEKGSFKTEVKSEWELENQI